MLISVQKAKTLTHLLTKSALSQSVGLLSQVVTVVQTTNSS